MPSGRLTVQTGPNSYATINATPIDPSSLKVVKLTEAPQAAFQRLIEAQETLLRGRYTQAPDLSGHPAYQDYARIMVGGKEVARLDNNGYLTTSNRVGAMIEGRFPNTSPIGRSGPVLAQLRADVVAKLLGGEVVMAKTAMDQGRYDTLPKPKPSIDETAMAQDPLYRQVQETKRARLLFLAQQMA